MILNDPSSVLIVGAGPTGLTLANILARYRIPVRIIEKKAQLSQHTKATNLMQRNQEFLNALGLLDPLNAIGGQMRRMMVHAYGRCFGPRTMRLRESPFPDVILCGQHNFEAVAAAGLAKQGVGIEFDTELADLSQDADGCTAELRRRGRREMARFRYVVGCDGFASATRTFTRNDFTPRKTGVAIRQVDCRLKWRRLSSMEQMWLFYFDHGFGVVVPLLGGVTRVLTIEPKPAIPEREPTIGEMQAKLREITADATIELTSPDWFSYTDLSMGLAPGLIDGRIVLAGDSGNPVLPNGGQGMNTGIGDAFNLGWKLASVLKQQAPTQLLDTYNVERHALRAALQKAQFNSLKYTTLSTPKPMQAAFRTFMEPILNWGGEYEMAKAFSELTIHTRKSPLTLDAVGGKGLRAGDRALDAAVASDLVALRLYDLIYRGGWTLFAFTGRGRDASIEAIETALASTGHRVPAFLISTVSCDAASTSMLFDLDEEAHRVYSVRKPTLYLIRPDGHVGARVRPDQVQALSDYMDRWLGDASLVFTPLANLAQNTYLEV